MFMGSLNRICRYLHLDIEQGYRIFAQVRGVDLNRMCVDIDKHFADYRINREGMSQISWCLSHKTLDKLDKLEYEIITTKVRKFFDDKYGFSINYEAVKLN
jgi:hypothetical protein